MKKIFFLLAFALLLISESASCQWYTRRYGVNNINQLSQQQLTESFLRSRGGVRAGSLLSGVSAIGIVAGAFMFTHDSPYSGDIGINVLGVLVLGATIPMEITGLTILGVSYPRLQSIKAVMKNTDVHLGVRNYYQYNCNGDPNCSAMPCLSVTFRF
jgi:hypothetical protein